MIFNDLIKINKDEDVLSCHLCITPPLPSRILRALYFVFLHDYQGYETQYNFVV